MRGKLVIDNGKLRMGREKLPTGWEVKKLGEVGKAIYGYTEKASLSKIGPKFLRITDIQNGGVNWETVPFCKINKTDLGKYILTDGDIVFVRTGATTGKSFLVRNPPRSVFASYLIKVHITNKELLPKYLFLFFQTKTYWDTINAGVSGSAQGGFNATKLSELSIPLPPLPEQKRIVAILDKAFAAIATAKENAEKNLKNAHELFESYLLSVFANPGDGWVTKKLEEITTKIGSGATPLGGEKSYKQQGISLIRSLNVHDMGFRKKDLAFLDKSQADKLSNVVVESGDVLLNITGASIARCCIVPDDVLPARVNQHVSILRLKKSEMIPEYLHFTLVSKEHKVQLLNTGEKAGATRQALTKAILEEYYIGYPEIPEQKRIVAKLDALSAETKKLEAIYRQKIADLDELKKSVLKKAFAGQL